MIHMGLTDKKGFGALWQKAGLQASPLPAAPLIPGRFLPTGGYALWCAGMRTKIALAEASDL